jgi:AAA15 family ATPase/GTPase
MIKYIKVKNFYSITETQEMSFEINPKDILDHSAREIVLKDQAKTKLSINLVACVIGANGSGKSNFLKAINFIISLVQNSYNYHSDKFLSVQHSLMKDKSTTIEIGFVNNNSNYKYFIEFNSTTILKEYLKKTVQRETNIFEMSRKKNQVEIKSNIKINQTDKDRFTAIERSHIPLLSSLINTGYLTDMLFFKTIGKDDSDIIKNFSISLKNGMIDHVVRQMELMDLEKKLHENQILLKNIIEIFKKIDSTITEIKTSKGEFTETKEARYNIDLIHSSKNQKFSLNFFQESHGTQQLILLLVQILPALENGGLVIIDEIESALHPDLTKKLISLFEGKKTNPKNAQIIFSTHQHPLIANRTKTQIFIAQKDNVKLATELYRLDDVEGVRNDENYYHKYMAGAYGGVPKNFSF